jgi:hypothetical protein
MDQETKKSLHVLGTLDTEKMPDEVIGHGEIYRGGIEISLRYVPGEKEGNILFSLLKHVTGLVQEACLGNPSPYSLQDRIRREYGTSSVPFEMKKWD